MKFIKLFVFVATLLACTTMKTSPMVKDTRKATTRDTEGSFAFKKIPNRIKGFTFIKKVNTYFKNTVSKKKRKKIIAKILKKRKIKSKKSRFSHQLKAKSQQFNYPVWSDYFGKKKIRGTIDLNMLIGKTGYAEVIIIKTGISLKVDRVFISHAIKFPFRAAIHKRSKKNVRAWYRFQNIYE